MTGQEQFECRACFNVGPLNVRGACERCDSQAVISQELLSLIAARVEGADGVISGARP